MNIKLVFCTAALASFGLIACGDDTTGTGGGGQGGGGTGGSSTTTTTTTTGGGGEGGGTTAKTCADACSELFACGSADSFALCPAWETGGDMGAPLTETLFLNGSNNDGCLATCEGAQVLIALVDPNNCSGTITTIKGANATFAESCEGGAGGAGGGN